MPSDRKPRPVTKPTLEVILTGIDHAAESLRVLRALYLDAPHDAEARRERLQLQVEESLQTIQRANEILRAVS